ncbi:PaaI family thioesterase [Gordonia sp. ABSL1-1]|uniref:PaaI family thioesterase n=1 Tax=Gordonia sp. ABSL1-1 TaxID=3053923 RepID=UPI002573D478|nr:PaaI family thioesterase [Gordonia sp. ABSL1-1]MDL9938803.1 PaaI family thioesterase [Gordonia sp. ABSL1-1]
MSGYIAEDIDVEELRRRTEVATGLAGRVRELVAATVVTDVDDHAIAAAQRHIEAATALLSQQRLPGSFGVRFNTDGTKRVWGNAVVGARNPIAPPVQLVDEGDHLWAEFDLGPAYEGPAGLVHGGVVAMILDQVLGSAAEHAGAPGMTGTLTIRYEQGTKLGPVRVEGRLDRVEGVKSIAVGTVSTPDGVCARAEGIFILPRWARGESSERLRNSLGDG